MSEYRIEKDTMGEVQVPANAYYGAQTQRSIENFKIAQDINKMPKEIIEAFAYLKKAAAITNFEAGILSKEKLDLISKACDEILEGKLDDYFPLVVWQTGSGTQSNMNVNEVVAYRGHVINGGKLSDKEKALHPNDDVNKSQSSNDTFPTAMHIAAYKMLMEKSIPAIEKLRDTLAQKSKAFMHIVKMDSVLIPNSQVQTNNVHPQQVIDFAKTLIGVPYKYASIDPAVGFDCSGFITYVFNHFKILVPRSSIGFTNVGKTVTVENAKPGDLILFTGTDSTEKFVGHMGLIVSNQNNLLEFIHSTSGKSYGVTITSLSDYYRGRYVKTVRIFPENDLAKL